MNLSLSLSSTQFDATYVINLETEPKQNLAFTLARAVAACPLSKPDLPRLNYFFLGVNYLYLIF